MEAQLEKKDLGFIGVCLLITVASLAIGIPYFYQAFPEASIDFRVTREEAQEQATAFLATRNIDLSEYRHSAIFRHHDPTKTFLERELGLQKATETIGQPVQLWRWSNRWSKELTKEEYQVDITTTGKLVGFKREIAEEAAGASLDESAAKDLAESFLTTELNRDLTKLEFVETESREHPNRIDHTFSWALREFAVGEATYRFYVTIQGDQIGGFNEELKVPEAWKREFDELRSRNEVTGQVAAIFMLVTILAMLAVFFGRVRARDIRWRTATIFGTIAAALTLLAELNNMPTTEFGYDTTDTYGSFLAQQLFNSLLNALFQGILIFFLTAAAEPLYRRHYSGQIQLGAQFSPTGIRTKRFLLGTILGLAMTAFFFAYQTLFYLAADHFGAWSPAQIPYSDMVNTYIPWIMVLLIGFMPAVSEEFMSRAFSIPFLHRYLKSRWAAVFIAALIWGFAHAGYPQQPFYVRGIEVGIAGIIIGFVFLRFGLLAPLVWHYTVDAFYTALILLRSPNPYFVVSAAISTGIMLVPLAIALILYWRQRRFADPKPLLNEQDLADADEEEQTEPETAAPTTPLTFAYTPLSPHRIAISAVVVCAALAFFALDYERPLDFVEIELTRGEAEIAAIAHLAATDVDPASYEIVTFHVNQPNEYAIKYLLERESVATVNHLYSSDLLASLWMTRFFRYGEKEEYRVAVHPATGALYAIHHILPEEAEGADMDEDQAREIAISHLRTHSLDPDLLVMKESSSEKLANRRDHRFVFEAREGDPRNIGELRFRVRIEIAGAQPTSLVRFLKVPESWEREREEGTVLGTILQFLLVALIIALVLHGFWLLIRHVRDGEIRWAPLFKIATIGIALFLLSYLNGLSNFAKDYDTQLTFSIFALFQLIGAIAGSLGIGVAIVAGLGLATGLYPEWPDRLRAARRIPEFRDALIGVALFVVANEIWDHLQGYIGARFIAYNPSPGIDLPSGFDTYFPFWDGLTSGLAAMLGLPILAGMVLYYGRTVLKKRHYWALALIAIGVIGEGSSAVHLHEFFYGFANFLIGNAFIVIGVLLFLRNNLLAYVLLGFVSLLSTVETLGSIATPTYQIQAAILLILALGLIGFAWWRMGRKTR